VLTKKCFFCQYLDKGKLRKGFSHKKIILKKNWDKVEERWAEKEIFATCQPQKTSSTGLPFGLFVLFARNEMIWPLGHFFGLFSMLKKIVPFRGMF